MRIQLKSFNGWFDTDQCECFKEDKYFNKSKITNEQRRYELLYKTKDGKWILNKWKGEKNIYDVISNMQAHKWLYKNGHFYKAQCVLNQLVNECLCVMKLFIK